MKQLLRTLVIWGINVVMLAGPLAVLAQPVNVENPDINRPGLTICDGPVKGERGRICDFAALIDAVRFLINWMIIVGFFLVVVVLSYAGFLFMTGKESNISKAKEMFTKVVIGYALMLGAWLIVRTIMKLLVVKDSYLFFFK